MRLIAHGRIEPGKNGGREGKFSLNFDAMRHQQCGVKDDVADGNFQLGRRGGTQLNRLDRVGDGSAILRTVRRHDGVDDLLHLFIGLYTLDAFQQERNHLFFRLIRQSEVLNPLFAAQRHEIVVEIFAESPVRESKKLEMKPFENEAETMQIGEMTIENRTDQLEIYGSLAITRDKVGLELALRLKALLDATVAELQKQNDLPEQVVYNGVDSVENPFKD